MRASRSSLPKAVASLTIDGNNKTLTFIGVTSLSSKYALTLKDITIVSKTKNLTDAAFTTGSSAGNTVIDGLTFKGKFLTGKGGSNCTLRLGKCSAINIRLFVV